MEPAAQSRGLFSFRERRPVPGVKLCMKQPIIHAAAIGLCAAGSLAQSLVHVAPAQPQPTRVAVLNFGPPPEWLGEVEDMVGVQITARMFADAVPLLERDRVEVVVLRANSGGGLWLEVEPLVDVLQRQYRTKFRVVTLVSMAISSAAEGLNGIAEVYFTPDGVFGCVNGFVCMSAIPPPPWDQRLTLMERASGYAGRSPLIMRSMQITGAPLSYTINKITGEVSWFQNVSGENVLNDGKHLLSLNAPEAVKCGFARGVASDVPELMKAMKIDQHEICGKEASDLIDREMRAADAATRRVEGLLVKYQLALSAAQEAREPKRWTERRKLVEAASDLLTKVRQEVECRPVLQLACNLPTEWFDEQVRRLKEMKK